MIYKSLREDTFEYYGKEGLSKLNVPDDFKVIYIKIAKLLAVNEVL